MRTNLFIVLLIFIFPMFLFAKGGDQIGNGADLAEQRFLFAYSNMDRFIEFCVASDICHLSESQKELLRIVALNHPEEMKNSLVFLKGSENKDLFTVDGVIRMAVTGSNIGSTIYINTETIYPPNIQNQREAITLGEAVSVLIHELFHHHGVNDEVWADLICSKIRSIVEVQTQTINYLWESRNLQLSLLDWGKKVSYYQLWITDGDSVRDLTSEILKQVKCKDPNSNIVGVNFWNMSWIIKKSQNDPLFKVVSFLYCKDKRNLVRREVLGELLVDVPLTRLDDDSKVCLAQGDIKVTINNDSYKEEK